MRRPTARIFFLRRRFSLILRSVLYSASCFVLLVLVFFCTDGTRRGEWVRSGTPRPSPMPPMRPAIKRRRGIRHGSCSAATARFISGMCAFRTAAAASTHRCPPAPGEIPGRTFPEIYDRIIVMATATADRVRSRFLSVSHFGAIRRPQPDSPAASRPPNRPAAPSLLPPHRRVHLFFFLHDGSGEISNSGRMRQTLCNHKRRQWWKSRPGDG